MLWKDTTTLKWMTYLIFFMLHQFFLEWRWCCLSIHPQSVLNPFTEKILSFCGKDNRHLLGHILGICLWLTVPPAGKLVKWKSSVKFLRQKEGTFCKGLLSHLKYLTNCKCCWHHLALDHPMYISSGFKWTSLSVERFLN